MFRHLLNSWFLTTSAYVKGKKKSQICLAVFQHSVRCRRISQTVAHVYSLYTTQIIFTCVSYLYLESFWNCVTTTTPPLSTIRTSWFLSQVEQGHGYAKRWVRHFLQSPPHAVLYQSKQSCVTLKILEHVDVLQNQTKLYHPAYRSRLPIEELSLLNSEPIDTAVDRKGALLGFKWIILHIYKNLLQVSQHTDIFAW